MYTSIPVPLNGSPLAEQVLPYAELLALGLGSEIDLLQVVEAPMSEVAATTPPARVFAMIEPDVTWLR